MDSDADQSWEADSFTEMLDSPPVYASTCDEPVPLLDTQATSWYAESEAPSNSSGIAGSALLSLFTGRDQTAEESMSVSQSVKLELKSYVGVNSIAVTKDPLSWWKAMSTRWPMLSKLAKYYMAIQASSVPSERVFSTAGAIVTSKRSCLDPENVNTLIFLKQNAQLP